MDDVVQVDPDSSKPDEAWRRLAVAKHLTFPKCLALDEPVHEDKVRFVCISDTHNATDNFTPPIPAGDVLLHAGDFTQTGLVEEIEHFNAFLGTLPHPYKVVIAGNHEISFDDHLIATTSQVVLRRFWSIDLEHVKSHLSCRGMTSVKQLLTNCTYLEDSEVTVFGLRVYGCPWQPIYGGWAFNIQRGADLLEKWNTIPTGVDVLLTHGPPLGILDLAKRDQRAGCVELYNSVCQRIKPKLHVFGHIHEAYGMCTNGTTYFVNASSVNLRYRQVNEAILFDIPLPAGVKKADWMQKHPPHPDVRMRDLAKSVEAVTLRE